MDMLGLAGIVLGIAVILIGNMIEGGLNASLMNGAAAIIVFGGTLAAVMVQTPFAVMRRASSRALWLVLLCLVVLDSSFFKIFVFFFI